LRKTTYEDKASYGSTPPCTVHACEHRILNSLIAIMEKCSTSKWNTAHASMGTNIVDLWGQMDFSVWRNIHDEQSVCPHRSKTFVLTEILIPTRRMRSNSLMVPHFSITLHEHDDTFFHEVIFSQGKFSKR